MLAAFDESQMRYSPPKVTSANQIKLFVRENLFILFVRVNFTLQLMHQTLHHLQLRETSHATTIYQMSFNYAKLLRESTSYRN